MTEFPLRRGSQGTLIAEHQPGGVAGLDLAVDDPEAGPRRRGRDRFHLRSVQQRGRRSRRLQSSGRRDAHGQGGRSEAPEVFKEVRVHVGCQTCGTDSCDSVVQLGSVEISFSLGMGLQGFPAGEVYVSERELTAELTSPRTLRLSAFGPDVEQIRDAAGALRQVVAPERFVDIQATGPNGYTVDVYPPSARGERGQRCTPWPTARRRSRIGASRIPSRTLRGRTASRHRGAERSHLRIRPTVRGFVVALLRRRPSGVDAVRTQEGSDRIVTEAVQDGAGNVASVVRTTYRSYPWGESVRERVVDPDGAALSTTYGHHEASGQPGYAKVAWSTAPDGSW